MFGQRRVGAAGPNSQFDIAVLGLATAVGACSIGAMIVFLAGCFHWLEGLLMRFVDILMAFPALLLANSLGDALRQALDPRPQQAAKGAT